MMKKKRYYILFVILMLVLSAAPCISGRGATAIAPEDFYLEGNGNSLKRESAVNDFPPNRSL